jgi:hypothetical protein
MFVLFCLTRIVLLLSFVCMYYSITTMQFNDSTVSNGKEKVKGKKRKLLLLLSHCCCSTVR